MTYFIDRDLGRGVPRALQQVRDDVIYLEQRYAHDTPDEEWLSQAGREGWIVITRNRKISTNPAQQRAVRDHGVRCFCLVQKRPLTKWQMLTRLVRSWDAMEAAVDTRPAPFMIGIRQDGSFRDLLS